MSFRWLNQLDGGGEVIPPDQEVTPVAAAKNSNTKSSDSFVLQRSGLNVVANGVYQFAFSYLYEDPENPSQTIIGPRSPNFTFTLGVPDLTKPVTNLSVTPGLLLYGVKWDVIDKNLSANKWFIDAQIYESLTGAFSGEEYLVWNGTGNSATILVSDTNNRWIRVDTRDQDFHKKSVVFGPFKASDPITVDTVGPDNVTSVSTTSGIDTSGYLGFNAFANVSWPAVSGGGIRGYRIRFSNDNGATYSYVDSPGTGTTYKLAGLVIGSTYQIAVATYDEYNNTSSAYVSAPNVTVSGTPSVSNFITGGPFEFGVGVGGVSTNKGLYFDASNYWYVNATNSARLKVGGATSNYLLWDGSTFAIDGNITARGGTFSGNIFMSTTGASIYSGTIDSATGNLTGNGFALNSSGLKVANGTNSVTLSSATGAITANAGSIAGWNLSGTTLSKNNVILDSSGQIQLGATAATAFYLNTGLLNGGSTWLAWAGNNVPDANAKFRVRSDGTLFVTGAVFGTGTTIAGYATTDQLATTNTNLATTNTNLATTNTNLTTTNTTLATKLTKSSSTITDSSNNITAINANGITIFTNGTAATSAPTTGARLVVNSQGIAAFDSSSTNNSTGQTFTLSSTNGTAYFKGEIQASSGSFTGSVNANSGRFGNSTTGWTLAADGTLSNGVSGTISATTIFPSATGSSVGGGAGSSNNLSYYSNRGIMVYPGAGSPFGYTAIGTNIVTFNGTSPHISSSASVRINDSFAPNQDNAYSLGFTTARWQIVRSAGGVSTDSDQRIKKDIVDSSLGLSFIKLLRPVSYKYISGGKVYKDGASKEFIDGVIVEPEWVDKPGQRTHWGFLAQEVKEAVDQSGVEDFGGWQLEDVSDPDSGQLLVHHQFIGPITKAIQELSDMVESLQEEVNTLKGA